MDNAQDPKTYNDLPEPPELAKIAGNLYTELATSLSLSDRLEIFMTLIQMLIKESHENVNRKRHDLENAVTLHDSLGSQVNAALKYIANAPPSN